MATVSEETKKEVKQFKAPEKYEGVIPNQTLRNLEMYVNEGCMPGGFLSAVLSNDLFRSYGRADLENRRAMGSLVELIYSYTPAGCWGDRKAVSEWRIKGGKLGGACG